MVTVTANPLTGEVVRTTRNPELSQVRVEETVITYSKGFRKPSKRSALITGATVEMQTAYFANQKLSGKIIVMESLVPFRSENITKDLKIAGNTGIICTFDDQPIFRTTEFTDDLDARDILIAHNNTELIKVETARLRALPSVEPEFILEDDFVEEEESADMVA